jgi:hypothetical protein
MVRDNLLSPERQRVAYARIRELARELAREQEGGFTLPQLTRRILESEILDDSELIARGILDAAECTAATLGISPSELLLRIRAWDPVARATLKATSKAELETERTE